jgi:hypothetical protein
MPYWPLIAIKTLLPLPKEETIFNYDSYDIGYTPETDDTYSSFWMKLDESSDINHPRNILRRIISLLSYYEFEAIEIAGESGNKSQYKMNIGKSIYKGFFDLRFSDYKFSTLQINLSPIQATAIAIFRNALINNSPPLKFVEYSRILMLQLPRNRQGTPFMKYINNVIEQVLNGELTPFKGWAHYQIKEHAKIHKNIGRYLWESCRSAAAHTSLDGDFTNPDDVAENDRYWHALAIMEWLACYYIENTLNLQRNPQWQKIELPLEYYESPIA